MNVHSWWVPYAILFFGIWDLITGITRLRRQKQGIKQKGLGGKAFVLLGILFIITGIWAFWL
ncbi:hypothetical protein ACXO2A_07795 [Lactobacillus delbrueckii subsp. bulgaricus]|nr:hypothetical protein [Lactobacillus delbrueckii subsp. bulgaricus]MBT8900354.1 hypothetical protein [Lactobacillus delbrueckii subsp. bulgaricus]MBT8906019.1 hypothetical protein [Lactobacillus delbrueckii subsp. bulgaricus]MBT8907859.1 hypothetical protein [Lactobacillus delbrueckii subsp. bulgaricus]MBT8921514.1 hypothetical protein [Lactobacillus delbrueckii subsp. bulgaricus]